MALIIWLWWPILIRELADRHLFFIRVPEMSAAFIMRDHKVHKLIIAVSGKYRQWAEKYKQEVEKRDEGIEVVVVDPKHPLVYIGEPWKYTVHRWYERNTDRINPSKDPRCFLSLSERTHDFEPPAVDTGDPIQVSAKIIASLIPHDPLKMVFGVNYFLEAFVAETEARWRRVAATLHYFIYETDKKDEKKPDKGKKTRTAVDDDHEEKKPVDFDPEIYVNAHRRLLLDMWLFGCRKFYGMELDDEGLPHARLLEREPEAVYWDIRKDEVRLGKLELAHPDPAKPAVAWDVYGDYGDGFFYVLQEPDKFWFREGSSGVPLQGDAAGIYWQQDPSGVKIRKIQVKAHRRALFVFDKDVDTWRGPKVFYKYGIPEDKAAMRIFRDWGLVPKDLELRDIDPTDLRVRMSLQKRLQARATALETREKAWGEQQKSILEAEGVKQKTILLAQAQQEKDTLEGEGQRRRMVSLAEGQKQRDILEGEGIKQRRESEGAGEGKARQLAHEGDAAGFAAKLNALGIKPGTESAAMPLIAEAMERVARATELMVMSGSGSGWSDLFGTVPALSKLWNGKGKAPSQSDLIKALSNLSEVELRSVIEALPRPGGAS
jgi:regulator of protease activity HflC (stomatin/prohibitin superfamily)